METGYKAEIIWIKNPVNPDDEGDFEECEAIGIRKYLGNYYLVKPI